MRTVVVSVAVPLRALVVALALAVAAGCGPDGPSAGACADELLPGDLVITEIFADFAPPPGSSGVDDGQEWFEIYNATSRPIDLTGITVIHRRGSGEMARALRLPARTIQAGAYLVLGSAADDLRPAWVELGYGDGLGDLYNSGDGVLALSCGDTEIDSAVYADVRSGRSRQLDGGQAPDYTANDTLTGWCDASKVSTTEFTPGNHGTPGAANEDCQIVIPGQCRDGDALRATVAPAPGDLVITEVMTNPAAVGDTLGEWFEVTATRDVDLNGLGLDRAGDTANPTLLQAEACLRVTAGQIVVFGRSTDAGVNGGLPPLAGTFPFALVTGTAEEPGDVQLVLGPDVIDAVAWTSSRSGRALQVDPDAATAAGNDDQASWCDATQPYGDGDFGTPGAPNAECPAVAPPGACLDGMTSRPIVYPEVGDLVITEVMPNPDAVSDTVGEWFEVTATRDVDLNGLGLDRAGDAANPSVVTAAACLRLPAGERAVFARSSDATVNGGLPAVTAGFPFALVSGTPTLPGDVRILRGADVLDAVTWTSSRAGAARALDVATALDVTLNDSETAWCDAAAPYGAGDLGPPGAPNPACGAPTTQTTCLDDGVPRALVAPAAGDLVITEVLANPSAVADGDGEWFEVRVTRDVDLNGVGLDRAGDAAAPIVLTQTTCLRARAGDRLVFARDADPTMNGGLPPVFATFGFALIDGSASTPGDVQLVFAGEVLDQLTWTSTVAGATLQVDPDFETPAGNDLAGSACRGTAPYGAGDLGSPGAANAECAPVAPPGTCLDGATSRPIVKPAPGELVITEFLANPATVTGFTDAQREWFEITNTGAAAFDLNALGLSRDCTSTANVIAAATCLSVPPGGFALFARQADPAINGGLPAVDATFTFPLADAAGIAQVCEGTAVLDQVTWVTGQAMAGTASQLDPTQFTTTANDDEQNFCEAAAPYGDGTNTGTPRAANAACP